MHQSTAHADGSLGQFAADVRRGVAIARQLPWLVAIEWVLLILPLSMTALAAQLDVEENPAAALPFILLLPVYVLLPGWLGAQRVVMRAVMVGQPVGLGDIPRLWREQVGRFLLLALLATPAYAVTFAVTVVATDDLLGQDPQVSTAGIVGAALVAFAIAVAMTLMTPALALEADKPTEAARKGWQRLRVHWRSARWHALVAPAALFLAGVLGQPDGKVSEAATIVVALALFLARAATVALHLRIRDRELAVLPPPRPVIL